MRTKCTACGDVDHWHLDAVCKLYDKTMKEKQKHGVSRGAGHQRTKGGHDRRSNLRDKPFKKGGPLGERVQCDLVESM